jgi:hypothetical protein
MSQVNLTTILSLPEDHPSLYRRLPGRWLPQKVYIDMDCDGILFEEYDADVMSMEVWNRCTIRLFGVPENVDAASLKSFVKEHLDMIQVIHDGHHLVSYDTWPLHGTLTDKAEDALDDLQAAAEKYDWTRWYIMGPDAYLATVRDDQIRRDVEKHRDVLETAQEYLDDECQEPGGLWIEGGAAALAEEIERRMQDMEEEEDEDEDEEG